MALSTAELPPVLSEALARTAAALPGAPAVTLGERTLSFGELHGAVRAAAAGLQAAGVRPGDRVALLLPNIPQFPISYFAASQAGAIVVPMSVLLLPDELAYVVGDAGAETLIYFNGFDAAVTGVAQLATPLKRFFAVGGETQVAGAQPFEALPAGGEVGLEVPSADPQGPAVLIYTSGTTGKPKGATLSHRNVISNADAARQTIGVTAEDRFLTVLPLFHSFGATVCMILPLLVGAANVLLPRFVPPDVLEVLERAAITVFAGVPSMYNALVRVRGDRRPDLSRLRLCVSGGAPLPVELLHAFEERFGALLIEGYGPTEASPVVSVNPIDGRRRIGSAGLPIPGVELRVVDDQSRDVPTGEVGEVLVRGPNVMLGYWQRPADTAETVRNGWLYTGDMGRLDADGYLYIVDRKKDMVIVSGMNVYPREVEDVIYHLPAIAECAVAGVPSERRGEDVKAFVVLKEGASLTPEEVLDHCRAHLASYKVPRQVEIVADLPKSPTGKTLKRALVGRE